MFFLDVPSGVLRLIPSVFSKWPFPQKNPKKQKQKQKQMGDWGHTFLKTPLDFLGFLFCPWKFQKKQSFTPETPQHCVTPLRTFKA